MRFLQYLIFSTLACYAAAIVTFSQIFTVDDTCISDKRDLDSMLAETLDMVSNAITALDTLLDTSNYGLFRGNGKNMARLIEAASTAWGMTVPRIRLRNPSSGDLSILSQAKATFETLQNVLQTGQGLPPTDDHFLFCDSVNLVWTTIARDIFLGSQPGKTIAQEFPGASVHGLWKDPNHQIKGGSNFMTDEYNGVGICADEDYPLTWGGQSSNRKPAEAITFYLTGNMVLCPRLWSGYKLSLKSLQGTTGSVEWKDFKAVPGVFLHEMLHFISPSGAKHIKDQPTFVDATSPTKEAAYGTGKCILLSNGHRIEKAEGQRLALLNADSYNVFATMVYIPGADWVITGE